MGRHLGFTTKLRNSHGSAQTPRAMLPRPFRYHRSFMYAAVTDISYIAESVASMLVCLYCAMGNVKNVCTESMTY